MIAYVDCLNPEPVGNGLAAQCWRGGPQDDEDELLPRKMAALQPKTDGSLRRRLLSAKIYQQQDALWKPKAMSCSMEPAAGDLVHGNKGVNSGPWVKLQPHNGYHPQPDVQPNTEPCNAEPKTGVRRARPVQLGRKPSQSRLLLRHHRPAPLSPLAREARRGSASSCSGLVQRRRSSCGGGGGSPPLKHQAAYAGPYVFSDDPADDADAAAPFRPAEPEAPPQYRYRPKGRGFSPLTWLTRRRGGGRGRRRTSSQSATHATPLLQSDRVWKAVGLEEDSKWSVHYTTQKSQREHVFLTGARPLGDTDDLHSVLKDCDRLNGYGSSLHFSRGHAPLLCTGQSRRRTHRGKKKSSVSSEEDERFFFAAAAPRPLTPLINPCDITYSGDDIVTYSCDEVMAVEVAAGGGAFSLPVAGGGGGEMVAFVPRPRLPTPEEKMRQQAQSVPADIVAINVTGESFERQASFRRVMSYTETLPRRPRRPSCSRRQTITGIPDDITRELASKGDVVQDADDSSPYRRLGEASSSASLHDAALLRQSEAVEVQYDAAAAVAPSRQEGQQRRRRIRAQRGEGGIASLMASLSPTLTPNPSITRSPSPSHGDDKDQDDAIIAPYRALSETSSYSLAGDSPVHQQDLQRYPSDLLPLLPFDPAARYAAAPQSPLSSSPSSPLSDHLLLPHRQPPQVEWSYPSDSSELSYLEVLELDQQQSSVPGEGESWDYSPLSPSTAGGADWSQESGYVPGEGWSCDPLLLLLSSPSSRTDCSSLCSEDSINHSPHGRGSGVARSATPRSILFRKAKHAPPPPRRCDSLKRGGGGPPAPGPRPLQTPPPATTATVDPFGDPWVPRSRPPTVSTVSTFAALSSPVKDAPPSSLPLCGPARTAGVREAPPEGLSLVLDGPRDGGLSPGCGLHRLASPSSGYSSQSNTPPLSSPLTPSSPSSLLCSSSSSSTPTRGSEGEGIIKPRSNKPAVPERKSSLSSSFSSTSSLSSCASSSESSVKHHHPPPPPPPPLPGQSRHSSPAPFPAPPPAPKLSIGPPPPPPPLPGAFSQTSLTPVAPPLSPRPAPPPYSHAIRQSSRPPPSDLPGLSVNYGAPPLAPPLPPPLPVREVVPRPPRLGYSPGGPPRPLVTAEALHGLKLRSVKKQPGLLASTMLTVTTAPDDANVKHPSGTDAALVTTQRPGSDASRALSINGSNNTTEEAVAQSPGSANISADASQTMQQSSEPSLTCDVPPRDTEREKHDSQHEEVYAMLANNSLPANPDSAMLNNSLPASPDSATPTNSLPASPDSATLTNSLPASPDSATLTNSLPASPDRPQVKLSTVTQPEANANYINTNIMLLLPVQEYLRQQTPDATLIEVAEKQDNAEDIWQNQAQYFTFSDRDTHVPDITASQEETRGDSFKDVHNAIKNDAPPKPVNDRPLTRCPPVKAMSLERVVPPNSNTASKPRGSPVKARSLERPVLPKKPDLEALGLLRSPGARQYPWKKTRGTPRVIPEYSVPSTTGSGSMPNSRSDPLVTSPHEHDAPSPTETVPSPAHALASPVSTTNTTPSAKHSAHTSPSAAHISASQTSTARTSASPAHTTQTSLSATETSPSGKQTTHTLASPTHSNNSSSPTDTQPSPQASVPPSPSPHTPAVTSSPQRQKPPIPHKKPDLLLIPSPKRTPKAETNAVDVVRPPNRDPETETGWTDVPRPSIPTSNTCTGPADEEERPGVTERRVQRSFMRSSLAEEEEEEEEPQAVEEVEEKKETQRVEERGTTVSEGQKNRGRSKKKKKKKRVERRLAMMPSPTTLSSSSSSSSLSSSSSTCSSTEEEKEEVKRRSGEREVEDRQVDERKTEETSTDGIMRVEQRRAEERKVEKRKTEERKTDAKQMEERETMETKMAGIIRVAQRRVEERMMEQRKMEERQTEEWKTEERETVQRKMDERMAKETKVQMDLVEEEDETTRRRGLERQEEEEESSDTDASSCYLIGESRHSLSSLLSNESLRGATSLPDLLIREEGEEPREEEEESERRGDGPGEGELFGNVSAEDMLASSRPRTTEDLFAVIHRSKRKMLGRKDPEDDRRRSSSSSSSSWVDDDLRHPPGGPSGAPGASPCLSSVHPLLGPCRVLQRSAGCSSESFKALLLRKGSRCDASARVSAVELLRCGSARRPQRAATPDPSSSRPDLDLDLLHSDGGERLTRTPAVCDSTDSDPNMCVVTAAAADEPPPAAAAPPPSLRVTNHHHLVTLLSSSLSFASYAPPPPYAPPPRAPPVAPPPSPRSLTPPCSSAGRRFAWRCRLRGGFPMAAILERDSEEEEEDFGEVFLVSPESALA